MRLAITMLLLGSLSYAQPDESLRLCTNALDTCSDVVKQQDSEITLLKTQVKGLEDKMSQDTQSVIPWYIWLGAGVLTGAAGAVILHR